MAASSSRSTAAASSSSSTAAVLSPLRARRRWRPRARYGSLLLALVVGGVPALGTEASSSHSSAAARQSSPGAAPPPRARQRRPGGALPVSRRLLELAGGGLAEPSRVVPPPRARRRQPGGGMSLPASRSSSVAWRRQAPPCVVLVGDRRLLSHGDLRENENERTGRDVRG